MNIVASIDTMTHLIVDDCLANGIREISSQGTCNFCGKEIVKTSHIQLCVEKEVIEKVNRKLKYQVCYRKSIDCDCGKIHRGQDAECSNCGTFAEVAGFHADMPLCNICAADILS